jgi:hypothetical protein
MTDLTHRAEQAFLGALVTGRGHAAPDITASHFADQRHQAIYAALTGAVPAQTSLLARFGGWLTRLQLRGQIRDIRAYLDALPGLCPDPEHAADYAAMISQARQLRDQAIQAGQAAQAEHDTHVIMDSGAAGQLQASQAWLDQAAQQAAVQTARPRSTASVAAAGLPRATQQLARALAPTGIARQPAADRAAVVARANTPAPDALRREAQTRPRNQQPSGPSAAQNRLSTGDLQDLILADMLQQPAEASAIAMWLPAEVFTSGARRDTYRLIRSMLDDGRAVDPLIIAWEAGNGTRSADAEPGPAITAEGVLRIGALPVRPGTAATLSRVLLADHWKTTVLGPDWPSRIATDPGLAGPGPEEHTAPHAEALARQDPAAPAVDRTGPETLAPAAAALASDTPAMPQPPSGTSTSHEPSGQPAPVSGAEGHGPRM